MAIHLRPSAPIAADALLPGDPGRALLLAQELLVEPRMSNHARGLWGYYGETRSGRPLTIQATGIGGPSAAIVFHELARAGLQRAIRVGTCGALSPALGLGELIVASAALASDGTSRSYGADEVVEANPALTSALLDALPDAEARRVATTDLFYDAEPDPRQGWMESEAVAVEMEAATLFALGHRLDVHVACVLIVSDLTAPDRGRMRLGDEEVQNAARLAGRAAAQALEV